MAFPGKSAPNFHGKKSVNQSGSLRKLGYTTNKKGFFFFLKSVKHRSLEQKCVCVECVHACGCEKERMSHIET